MITVACGLAKALNLAFHQLVPCVLPDEDINDAFFSLKVSDVTELCGDTGARVMCPDAPLAKHNTFREKPDTVSAQSKC